MGFSIECNILGKNDGQHVEHMLQGTGDYVGIDETYVTETRITFAFVFTLF